MLTALITGDRTYLTRSLRIGFERTGSFHLIVVSGLHLAILAGCVFALARRLRLGHISATAAHACDGAGLCTLYRLRRPGAALILDDRALPGAVACSIAIAARSTSLDSPRYASQRPARAASSMPAC